MRRIITGRLPVLLRLAKLLLAAILAVFSCLYLLLAFSLHDFRAAKHVIIKALVVGLYPELESVRIRTDSYEFVRIGFSPLSFRSVSIP